ncbi:MAG: LytR C-terminal domain-containing protein [Frankiales bacterium]|nr:LytR C-terminal domain-containing protein [Frankiales bacterium]
MSRVGEPAGWAGDPVVEAGFAAAYALPDVAEFARPAIRQEERDPVAVLSVRPVTAESRRGRGPEPVRLSPGRAVAGAAVSVAGVCLGIATLLWVSDDPSQGPGPALVRPDSAVATAPAPVPVATPAPSAAPSAAAPVRTVVVAITVLNNSNRTGLADRAARRFQRGGWPVRLTGNFRGQIPVTTVYYDPGLEASARAFAADFAGIVRVRPRFATLPARGVVVVLTREFAIS